MTGSDRECRFARAEQLEINVTALRTTYKPIAALLLYTKLFCAQLSLTSCDEAEARGGSARKAPRAPLLAQLRRWAETVYASRVRLRP
jgi:hypothetical protein